MGHQWWAKGVPQDIKEEAAKKQQRCLATKIWENLEFSDYTKIISKKDNWKDIFEKYFSSKAKEKAKDGQVYFLKRLSDLRNIIAHSKPGFKKKDLRELEKFKDMFDVAYKNWNEYYWRVRTIDP